MDISQESRDCMMIVGLVAMRVLVQVVHTSVSRHSRQRSVPCLELMNLADHRTD